MTTMPPVLVTSLRAASKRIAAGANATFLVPIRAAAVPAARAATAQNAPALLDDTGVASATRFQASLRVSVSAHARKTNGVPDEPPREMRTCARCVFEESLARWRRLRARLSISVCPRRSFLSHISPCEVNIPQKSARPRSRFVVFRAVFKTRSSRYVVSRRTTDAGPASKTRGPKAIFGRSNDARSVFSDRVRSTSPRALPSHSPSRRSREVRRSPGVTRGSGSGSR